MSTHMVEVVPVALEKHPNADSLSVVHVYGYTVCVKTADWEGHHLGAYIPPDSIVPDVPEYAFLNGSRRIKVRKLRGIVSMGMLVKAPPGAKAGDDVMEQLGVTHYEPQIKLSPGEEDVPPAGYCPTYDVENARRYAAEVFVPGEELWVTEKIHGANGRFCFDGERFHCGSRTTWKKESETNIWWRALRAHPEVQQFLRENPQYVIYGEVYGQVQDLRYGMEGKVRIAVFDLFYLGDWLDPAAARMVAPELPWVPIVASRVPFSMEVLEALAEGASFMPGADHIREGIVAKPLIERTHPVVGRVHLKVISNAYLERS